MRRRVRLQELLVGVEGLALLRRLYDGSDAEAEQRLDEVRRILDDTTLAADEPMVEADVRTGYASWAPTYDEPGNLIVALEEPAVWSLSGRRSRGLVLDAACGTGRHARYLHKLGHTVVGVDVTVEMLRRSRTEGGPPRGSMASGDLRALPFADGTFDLVVCGLALAHLPELEPPVAELGRVLRPGGRLVASVLHPFQAVLGWHAPFADEEGRRGFVREHAHTHADYLAAFTAAGLALQDCLEPVLTTETVQAKRRAFRHVPEATVAAYVGLPAVLVWEVEKAR